MYLYVYVRMHVCMQTYMHVRTYVVELGNMLVLNREEGILVIPVLILNNKFYTGKPTYRMNTGIS